MPDNSKQIVPDKIKEFFDAYQSRFQNALNGSDDVENTVNAFADCFIEANPHGVSCGKNDEKFRKLIPQGNQYYREIGTKEMVINKIESNPLDENHYIAKVYWHSAYEKKGAARVTIDFSVIYLLQNINGTLKIFAYITGDEEKVLKEHGII